MTERRPRRGARIPARLAIRVVGVDDRPRVCDGDISPSGLFVKLGGEAGPAGEVGDVGAVVRLELGLPGDAGAPIALLARIVRVAGVDQVGGGRVVVGAAFEFLFTGDDQRAAVDGLIRRAADAQLETARRLSLSYQFDARVGGNEATVFRLGFEDLLLETDRPAAPGEVIECAVHTPASDRVFRFEGRVKSAAPRGDRYLVEVEVVAAPPEPIPDHMPESISDAIDLMLEESIAIARAPELAPARSAVHGDTSLIELGSVLTLIEVELLTGVLTVTRGGVVTAIYARGGRVVDVARDGAGAGADPLALLADVLWARDASFSLVAATVDREDRIGMPIYGLVLELARRRDEGGGAA